MRANIILTSHGHLAEEILKSAEMIAGDTSSISSVCMMAEDGLEGTTKKLEKQINDYSGHQIVIIADLYGGTPFNVASILKNKYEGIEVVSGLNLGMVIEALFSQIEDSKELANYLCEIGQKGISVVLNDEDSDEEFDIG